MSGIVSTLYKHIQCINIKYLWHVTLWQETSLVRLSTDMHSCLLNKSPTHVIQIMRTKSSSYHIWPHFQAKMSPCFYYIDSNEFNILDFFDLTIKFPSIKSHYSWIHIQEILSFFSINLLLSISFHHMSYNLSDLH